MADARVQDYDTILQPVITEKATYANELGKLIFKVPLTATKPQIKQAVENLFKVDVTKVNTILIKGKPKRFRGGIGKQNDYKKAIVTLQEGQSVDVMTGAGG